MTNLYSNHPLLPSGGRLHPRPKTAKRCDRCGFPLGWSYHDCPDCYNAIEAMWLADWWSLLKKENILPGSEEEKLLAQIIFDDIDKQPWTLVDIAMSKLTCKTCGTELGGGDKDCPECYMAFNNLWAYDQIAGYQGVMKINEHSMRVGRQVLRHPHRQTAQIVTGWKFHMPILLTGAEPPVKDWMPLLQKAMKQGFDLSENIYSNFEEAKNDLKRYLDE